MTNTPSDKTNILLVDGNSIWGKAWHAVMHKPGCTDSPLQAAHAMFLSILDPRSTGYVIDKVLWCWDTKQKRDKQREPKPESYYTELAEFKAELSKYYGAVNASPEGYEADDMVATAVKQSEGSCAMVIVASTDKDLTQLHSAKVRCYDPNKRTVLTKDDICERWGVAKPAQVAIALAIIGDHSDAIKGIPGWGPKRAAKVCEALSAEMSLTEAVDAIADQVPSDKQASFFESLDLTLLDFNVPGIPVPGALSFRPTPEFVHKKIAGLYERARRQYSNESVRSAIDFDEV